MQQGKDSYVVELEEELAATRSRLQTTEAQLARFRRERADVTQRLANTQSWLQDAESRCLRSTKSVTTSRPPLHGRTRSRSGGTSTSAPARRVHPGAIRPARGQRVDCWQGRRASLLDASADRLCAASLTPYALLVLLLAQEAATPTASGSCQRGPAYFRVLLRITAALPTGLRMSQT